MDTPYIEPLIHDWLIHFQKIVCNEEDSIKADGNFYMPFTGIPTPVINMIFQVTEYLELGLDTKYLTVHLYDKFMCNYFWEMYKAEIKIGPSERSWSQVCKRISSQSKLHLMSCIQLASKMDSHSKSLHISQILSVLLQMDRKAAYSRTTIFNSEFKVFKTIGFRIPLYTPLHCIEILLALTGLKHIPSLYNISIDLLDIAYLKHDQLYSQLECIIRGGSTCDMISYRRGVSALQTNILYLGAAIIVASSSLLCPEENIIKGIAMKLSKLIDIKDADIRSLAHILCLMVL